MLFLFAELFAPYAYAAPTPTPTTNPEQNTPSPSPTAKDGSQPTPSPTPSPTSSISYPKEFSSQSCTVSGISDADRQTLWDNTLGKPIEELTDLPLDSALAAQNNPAVNPIDPDAPINPAAGSLLSPLEQKISLASLSSITGVPEKELVEKYVSDFDSEKDDVKETAQNTLVTYAQAQAIARKQGKTAENRVTEALKQLGGIFAEQAEKQEKEALPEEDIFGCAGNKITLPGNPGREVSCAQLMAAVALRPDSCLLTGKIKGRVSYMANLNYDVTFGAASNATLANKDLFAPLEKEDPLEPNDPVNQHFTGTQTIALLSLNGGGNVLIPSFYEEWIRVTSTVNRIDFYVSLLGGVAAFTSKQQAGELIERVKLRRDDLRQRVDSLTAQFQHYPVGTAPAALTTEVAGARQNLVTASDQLGKYVDFKRSSGILGAELVGRQGVSIAFGMGWLASARLLYEINDRLLMQMSGTGDRYVKLYADKTVAKNFKKASSPWNIAKLLEQIGIYSSGSLGLPPKAFEAGLVRIINIPDESQNYASQSYTSIDQTNGIWKIQTDWAGPSLSVNFEDTSNFRPKTDDVTSLQIKTNNAFPGAVIHQRGKADIATTVAKLAVPYLISTRAFGYSNVLGIGAALLGTSWVLGEAPAKAGEKCDPKELNEFKSKFIGSVWLSYISIAGQFTANFAAGTLVAGTAGIWLIVLASVLEMGNTAATAYQFQANSLAIEYTSLCQDQQYKILAYQRLREQEPKENGTAQSRVTEVTDVIQSAIKGLTGAEESAADKLAKYQELLNFRTQMTDQNGFIQPSSVFFVHVEKSAWMMPTGLFDQLNGSGCILEENHPTSDGGVISISKGGIKKINKDGSVAFDFNDFYWKLRAASILRSQELARMIVPNKVITTQLNCGPKPFITITTAGSASLVDKTCPAGDCLDRELKKLVGENNFDGTNLESVFGKITSVDTEFGTASFLGNSISFTRTSLAGQVGIETRAPTLEQTAANAGLGSSAAGTSMAVLGNASVVLTSPGGQENIGVLRTIIAEKGKIEYDPVAKRLYVFVYVLGEADAQAIGGVDGTPSEIKTDIPGQAPIPVINLDVKGKPGFEDVAEKLQQALDKIQQDSQGGNGGMQVLETPDAIYYFTDDGKLKRIDKKTGEVQEFDITGKPKSDGAGGVIFPTDKGDITIRPGLNDQGQPIINVNGAGLKDEGVLEAAKGPGGIFTFNPSTGAITVYNGQDIPMDPRFATQGMGFVGTAEGTRGIPAENPFVLPPETDDSGFERRPTLSLPSWPSQALWFSLMMAMILVGVIAVRTRRRL
ncbi:MAG: hypothetical protein V1717_00165 [Candidatus Micrarchaeota archaeon]